MWSRRAFGAPHQGATPFHLDRRTFLALAASGMLLLPTTARAAQSTRVWRIGLFIPGQPPECGSDQAPLVLTALRQALRDLGYIESENYVLVVRCVLNDREVSS